MVHSDSSTHVAGTKGGLMGHIFRRFIHVLMILIPIYNYYWGIALWLLLTVFALVLVIEFFRLRLGFTLFGQRKHEAKQISSFAWGTLAMCLVLLWVPNKAFAIPIIAACAVGDPLLGELRRTRLPIGVVALLAVVVVALIWCLSAVWFNLSYAWMWLAPITVAAEWPNVKWLDDNALMMLVPLLLIRLVTL